MSPCSNSTAGKSTKMLLWWYMLCSHVTKRHMAGACGMPGLSIPPQNAAHRPHVVMLQEKSEVRILHILGAWYAATAGMPEETEKSHTCEECFHL